MLESPLDGKEIQPVHPKGDQSWVSIGRTYTEAETPILWPPHVKIWITGKHPDAVRDWGQEEKGTAKDKMVGWHHRFDGHEFEQAPSVGDGQRSLACCSPWGRKASDMTEWLNWTELNCACLEWHISKAFIIKCLFSTWYCAKLCSHIISFNCNNPVRYYYCLYFKDAETKTQTDRWLRQVLTLVLVPEPLVLNSFVTLLTLNEMRKSTGSMVDGKHCKYKRD